MIRLIISDLIIKFLKAEFLSNLENIYITIGSWVLWKSIKILILIQIHSIIYYFVSYEVIYLFVFFVKLRIVT